MRSFIIGLVVVLLSTTTTTFAHAGDNMLWAENPTQAELWANFGTLLDDDFAIFGGVEPAKFEMRLFIDKLVEQEFDVELLCEGEHGLPAVCHDMDTDLSFLPEFTIA